MNTQPTVIVYRNTTEQKLDQAMWHPVGGLPCGAWVFGVFALIALAFFAYGWRKTK